MASLDGRYSKVEVETTPKSPLPPRIEVAKTPTEADIDRATIQAIKGKGFAVTFSSHFAVAVIVGLAAAFAGHHSAPLPEAQEMAVRHLTEAVAALRADFTQAQAERAQRDRETEWKLNELLTRK